jgi:hypothetical protein
MRRLSRFPVVLALMISPIIGSQVAAQFLYPEIKTVPVERLIQNLETIVAKEPQNAAPLVNLARLHAMVFARKLAAGDSVEVAAFFESEGPWFGVGVKPIVPFKAVETKDAARLKEAKEHLRIAIDLYRRAIAMEPEDVAAKLGYAWCIEQSGERAQAITAYRQVIAEAWAFEQRGARPTETTGRTAPNNSLFPDQAPVITSEAARYLIPLLDREKDRDEIATLQDRMQMLQDVGRFITPIVIPLGDAATPGTFLDAGARVSFDADGSGIPKRWTWITPEAAWLVHAPDPTPVTSALQLFGSVTFWLFWENGYEAMTALDDNSDGALTGAELEGLALWRDTNRNGVANEHEVKPLAEWDIVALQCAHEKTRGRSDYVAFSPRGVTFANGRTRPTWDVLLYTRSSRGAATE